MRAADLIVAAHVWNLFLQTRLVAGADKERARPVLLRTLQGTRCRLSWQLFCGPAGTSKPLCAANYHLVGRLPTNQ